MEKRWCLTYFLLCLTACAPLDPVPPPAAVKTPEQREKPRPLHVESLPNWKRPALKSPKVPTSHPFLEKPGLDLPLLPRQPAWTGPYWDSRFDHWHYADLKWQSPPLVDWKLDLEFAKSSRQDPFSKLYVPVSNIDSVLDDIEREQQARKEDYPDFPIPLNLSIPY